jgi:hypothetical protein
VVGRIEVVDLGGDVAAELTGIEAVDPLHGGLAAPQSVPQSLSRDADGCDAPDPSDGYPSRLSVLLAFVAAIHDRGPLDS